MKEKDLQKKLTEIGEKFERSGLLDVCAEVATKLGEGDKISYDCYIVQKYLFKDDKFFIDYLNGASMFGGGHLKVSYRGETVLCVDSHSKEKRYYPIKSGVYNEFKLTLYLRGGWEQELRELLKQPKIKPVKEQEPEVAQLEIGILRSRFGDLFESK